MKAKDLVIPSIVIVVVVAIVSQFSWTPKSAREEKKSRKAEVAQKKTQEYLEKSARGEVDVLTEKYDINILQDQLNKHIEKQKEPHKNSI